MKRTIYSIIIAMGTALATQAQTPDTVRLGASYTNQAWYSLQNGIVGTTQSKDNWDLAFEINGGQSASIFANTQKTNFVLYKAPFKVLQWASVDTAGIKTWPVLNNSDKSWGGGAFSSTTNLNDPFDFGWGSYDMSTHFVTGDSVYVVKLSATVYKKLTIDNLANGSYNFTYANIDGSNEKTASLAKTSYPGKNYVYYDLTAGTVLDREPAATSWDFTFVKYVTPDYPLTGGGTTPYPVTGILQNKGVLVAQLDNVENVGAFKDTTGVVFKSSINEIGFDWKTFDLNTFGYSIKAKQLFFVKDKAGKYWKVVFTGFASTNGQFSFTKEPLSFVTGFEDEAGIEMGAFAVYPNPSSGENVNLLLNANASLGNAKVNISDAQGSIIYSEELNVTRGFSNHELAIGHMKSGIYFVSVNAGGKNYIQKFVKQ